MTDSDAVFAGGRAFSLFGSSAIPAIARAAVAALLAVITAFVLMVGGAQAQTLAQVEPTGLAIDGGTIQTLYAEVPAGT